MVCAGVSRRERPTRGSPPLKRRPARADPGGAAARLRKELAQLDGDRVARVALKRHLDDRERAFRAEVAARDDADRAADLWIGAAARDLARLVRTTATAPRAVAA